MSEEQLKAFTAKVQADASLKEQLKAEGADPVANAQAAGFAITTEDIQSMQSAKIKLSDNELDSVAGGGNLFDWCWYFMGNKSVNIGNCGGMC